LTGPGKKIARNTASMYGAELVGRFFSYLALVVLSRAFSLETYGQYSLAVTLVGLVSSFGDLGLNALTIREVAADPAQAPRYLRSAMVWRFTSSLLFLGGLALWGSFQGYEPILQLAVLAMATRMIFDGLAGGWVYLLQAHEEMALQGALVALGSVTRFLGLSLVVYFGWGLVAACAVWSGVSLLTLLALAAIGLRRGWRPDFSGFNLRDSAALLRAAIPLAVMGSLQTLYYRVDVVMLKSLSGNVSVALYANSYKLLELALMFANMAALAALPALAARRDDREAFGVLAEGVMKTLVLGGMLVSAVGLASGPDLLVRLFGVKYAEAGLTVKILFLSAAPFFLNALGVAVLTVRSPKRLAIWYLGLLAGNVALNLKLIPLFGPPGAAWATLACELGGAAVVLAWVAWETPRGAMFRLARTLVGGLAGALCVVWGGRVWPGWQWVPLGPLVFAGTLFLGLTVRRAEWRALGGFFRRG